MSGLTDELRRLTSAGTDEYKVDGDSYWTDDQLLLVLASNAKRSDGLRAAPNRDRHGKAFSADIALGGVLDEESPGALVDRNGAEVVLGSSETIDRHGHIDFDTDMYPLFPMTWSGTEYDLTAAAGEVLNSWANALATAYDIKMDGQDLSRSQMTENLRKAAAEMTGGGGGIGTIKAIATYGVQRRPYGWWRTW